VFNRKADVFNAILIVSLTVLAVVQVHGLVIRPGAAPVLAAPVQYTVERQPESRPEARPEAPPPRAPGRSGVRVARVHLADATN
jgi:hypothetical protein